MDLSAAQKERLIAFALSSAEEALSLAQAEVYRAGLAAGFHLAANLVRTSATTEDLLGALEQTKEEEVGELRPTYAPPFRDGLRAALDEIGALVLDASEESK